MDTRRSGGWRSWWAGGCGCRRFLTRGARHEQRRNDCKKIQSISPTHQILRACNQTRLLSSQQKERLSPHGDRRAPLRKSGRIVAVARAASVRKACQTIPYNAGFSTRSNCSNSQPAPLVPGHIDARICTWRVQPTRAHTGRRPPDRRSRRAWPRRTALVCAKVQPHYFGAYASHWHVPHGGSALIFNINLTWHAWCLCIQARPASGPRRGPRHTAVL